MWHYQRYTYSEPFVIRAPFVLLTVTYLVKYLIRSKNLVDSAAVQRWTQFNLRRWSSINAQCWSLVWWIQTSSQITTKRAPWITPKINCFSGNYLYCAQTNISRSSCDLWWGRVEIFNMSWIFHCKNSRWIPHKLSVGWQARVVWSSVASKNVCDIDIIGDELWFKAHDPESKQQWSS